MKNTILLVIFLLFSPLAFAQTAMPDMTATTIMLMNAATTSDTPATSIKPQASKPTPTDEYVTDEVTMPDGSKAFLKHKKTSTSAPVKAKSDVVQDRVSYIKNPDGKVNYGKVYVMPFIVKGTQCVSVVTDFNTNQNESIAISCNWK